MINLSNDVLGIFMKIGTEGFGRGIMEMVYFDMMERTLLIFQEKKTCTTLILKNIRLANRDSCQEFGKLLPTIKVICGWQQ
jgi:hypothetical protein